ncbi:hypothetical protein IQ07DRAFT_99407 [Pyrenochaeta sp. DS3sAY3a]|nr:hypothetical protein IQ07DRAFT_99407 [Pyrenochaeta sp. DS3sAY3a]
MALERGERCSWGRRPECEESLMLRRLKWTTSWRLSTRRCMSGMDGCHDHHCRIGPRLPDKIASQSLLPSPSAAQPRACLSLFAPRLACGVCQLLGAGYSSAASACDQKHHARGQTLWTSLTSSA